MRARLFATLVSLAVVAASAFDMPGKVIVVSDDNYPPYLFRGSDGTLRGIVKDKWELWSRKTGVPVEVRGTTWAAAQESVRKGEADVIEALDRTITGITDAASMRGFTIAAKEGSACADWLRAQHVESIRTYPDSERLVAAAGAGEVKLFCMDTLAAQYFLVKHGLAEEFRQSPVLYSAPFDWAVRHGRARLRDYLQVGFQRIDRAELAQIDAQWRGSVVAYPISTRYLMYLIAAGLAVLGFSSVILFRNHCLRRLVRGKSKELMRALESLKENTARAQYFATRDPLTDLPNRQLLRDRLALALARAQRRGRLVGVVLVDLDRFKAVNDTFGQEFGDRVLKMVAARLVECAGPGATVARVSGDEFVMILSRTSTEETSAVAASALARLCHPFDIDGQRVYCTASAGVVVFPGDGTTPAELLRNAAIAMDCAKENGRNNVQHYRPEMQDLAARRLALETELRGALERREFEVYYQARVALATGKISGFEALLRWRHPVQGLLGPSEFIPARPASRSARGRRSGSNRRRSR